MRIHQIEVTNLFGSINLNVRLKKESQVTIVHAPNGYGKTTLLKLVDALMNRRFLHLFETPFSVLTVTYSSGDMPVFAGYAATLCAINESKTCNFWVLSNFACLATPNGMANALKRIFDDPKNPPGPKLDKAISVDHHWLFQTMMNILRTESGRKDGYGYAGLASDTGIKEGITAGYILAADFTNRKAPLPDRLLQAIASSFAKHLRRIGKIDLKELLRASASTQCQSVFNFQMMNYRLFNPIEWLVSLKLKEGSLPFSWPTTHKSFLNTSDGEIASSTGNLICVGNDKVWIKCQSAFDGKIDKRKELCGRVGAMKLCYTTKELEKIRFYLVLDGFFDDSDLSLLADAGWDGVFYYDQLDALIGLVKKQLAPSVSSKHLTPANKRTIPIDIGDSSDLPMAAEND